MASPESVDRLEAAVVIAMLCRVIHPSEPRKTAARL